MNHKNKKLILVVDDDANDLFLIERTFRELGIDKSEITCLEDGEEAIAYMEGRGKFADRVKYPFPSAILTDLKMPKKNGFEVLKCLKGNPQFSIIPTVVFTSSSDMDDIKHAYRLGASAYHVKPSSTEQRRELLRILLEYWAKVDVPEVDESGHMLPTEGKGKLGEQTGVPTHPCV